MNNPQFSLGEGAISSYSSFSPIFGNKSRKIKPMNIRLRGDKRVIGSVAYEMAMLTKGVISFALLGPAFIWDFGAGLLLIKEAGGKVTDWDGSPMPFSGKRILATNSHIHNEMIQILEKIENGEIDQHEGSYLIGEILKKLYPFFKYSSKTSFLPMQYTIFFLVYLKKASLHPFLSLLL